MDPRGHEKRAAKWGVRLRGPTRFRSHLKIPHRPFASFAFSSPCIEYTFAHAREPVLQVYKIRHLTRHDANISENMRAHFGVLGQVAETRAVVARGRTGINVAVRPYALVRFSVFSLSRSAKNLIRPANKLGYRAASILPMREFAQAIASPTSEIRSPLGNWSA